MMKFFSWIYFSEVFMGVDVALKMPNGTNEKNVPIRGAFYRGSQFFLPLSEFMHVPIDQINYVLCGVISMLLGQFIRHKLPPKLYSARTRGFLELFFGLLLISFCFGNQLRVLLLQSVVAYLMMIILPTNQLMAILVTVWSLFYLTLVHLCRLQYDYGGYTMDISGPVMVQTQKLSSLAFNLVDGVLMSKKMQQSGPHQNDATSNGNKDKINDAKNKHVHINSNEKEGDGLYRRSSITTTQSNGFVPDHSDKMNSNAIKHDIPSANLHQFPTSHIQHAVVHSPGPIDFFAYTLYFHGSIVGPFLFYSEYQDYLNGYTDKELPTYKLRSAIKLFLRTLCCGLLSAYMSPYFYFGYVLTKDYLNLPLYQRYIYTTISLFLERQKYYFAWGLSELNGALIGVGYTSKCSVTGENLYLNVRNFDFVQVETGSSLKCVIDAWNIATTRWLREVFYNRLPNNYRTVFVFVISAFWHGFYPGYYLMFLSFALFTLSARIWRRNFRHLFLVNSICMSLYNVFTTVLTNFIINYGQAPFHLLDLSASVTFLKSFYYIPHILSIFIITLNYVRLRLKKSGINHSTVMNSTTNVSSAAGVGGGNGAYASFVTNKWCVLKNS